MEAREIDWRAQHAESIVQHIADKAKLPVLHLASAFQASWSELLQDEGGHSPYVHPNIKGSVLEFDMLRKVMHV